MRLLNTIGVRLILALGLLALAPQSRADGFLDYLRDRALDFADIFRFKVSPPEFEKSVGVSVRATALVQASLLHHDGESVGMDRRAMGLWDENRTAYGISLLSWTELWRDRATGNRFTDPNDAWAAYVKSPIMRRERVHWDDGREQPFSCGIELYTGVLPGIDFGIYPGEFFDFVFGIFTVDASKDDLVKVERAAEKHRWPLIRETDNVSTETLEGQPAGAGKKALEPVPADTPPMEELVPSVRPIPAPGKVDGVITPSSPLKAPEAKAAATTPSSVLMAPVPKSAGTAPAGLDSRGPNFKKSETAPSAPVPAAPARVAPKPAATAPPAPKPAAPDAATTGSIRPVAPPAAPGVAPKLTPAPILPKP